MTELDRAFHLARTLRMIVVMLCRGAALVFAYRGLSTLTLGFYWYIQRRPLYRAGMMPASEAYEWIQLGLERLAPGVLLALLSTLIARWLVPAPRAVCLRCGYSTTKLTKPVCPECGAPVPIESTGDAGPRREAPH